MEITKYLLIISTAGNTGDEKYYTIYPSEEKAKKAFEKEVEELTNQTIEDNGLSDEEAAEYREEVEESGYYYGDYMDCKIDPNYEWGVYLLEVIEKSEEED